MSNAITTYQHGYTHMIYSGTYDIYEDAIKSANELNAYLNKMSLHFPVYLRKAVEIVHQKAVFDDPFEQWRVSCRYSIGYVNQAPAGLQYSIKPYDDDATYKPGAFNALVEKKVKFVNR